jgi:hypothetical protein
MRNFIVKTISFIFIFITTFVLIVVFNFGLFHFDQKSLNFKNKNVLLLGDSNMECAINDSIFSSGINKASSSDSYFYSYLKLKNYISINPKIDTVFLSFAPHNVFDNGWLLSDSHIYSRFRYYYYLMDWSDFEFLLSKKPQAVLSSIPSIIEQTFKNSVRKIIGISSISRSYGGFRSLDRDILADVKLKLINGEPLPFFKIPDNFTLSKEEITYLDKIILYCNKNDIKLYLINTPKRAELLNYTKYGVNNFQSFYDEKYSNVDFLDFSQMELPDDNYGDFVHLNRKGSTNFSSFLCKTNIDTLLMKFGRNKARTHNKQYSAAE